MKNTSQELENKIQKLSITNVGGILMKKFHFF
jgi:hypothetical protein